MESERVVRLYKLFFLFLSCIFCGIVLSTQASAQFLNVGSNISLSADLDFSAVAGVSFFYFQTDGVTIDCQNNEVAIDGVSPFVIAAQDIRLENCVVDSGTEPAIYLASDDASVTLVGGSYTTDRAMTSAVVADNASDVSFEADGTSFDTRSILDAINGATVASFTLQDTTSYVECTLLATSGSCSTFLLNFVPHTLDGNSFSGPNSADFDAFSSSSVTNIDACTLIDQAGEYRLTQDIVFGAGPCVTIDADDVVLDCDDHTISSNTNVAHRLIDVVSGRSNIVVRNCALTVSHSSNLASIGIHTPANNVTVENVDFTNLRNGISIIDPIPYSSPSLTIRDSSFTDGRGDARSLLLLSTTENLEQEINILSSTVDTRYLLHFNNRDEISLLNMLVEGNTLDLLKMFNYGSDTYFASGSTLVIRDNDIETSAAGTSSQKWKNAALVYYGTGTSSFTPSSFLLENNNILHTGNAAAIVVDNMPLGTVTVRGNDIETTASGPYASGALHLGQAAGNKNIIVEHNTIKSNRPITAAGSYASLGICRNDIINPEGFDSLHITVPSTNEPQLHVFENTITADGTGIKLSGTQRSGFRPSAIAGNFISSEEYALSIPSSGFFPSDNEVYDFFVFNNVFDRSFNQKAVVIGGSSLMSQEDYIHFAIAPQSQVNVGARMGIGGNYYSDKPNCATPLAGYPGLCDEEYNITTAQGLPLAADPTPMLSPIGVQIPCKGVTCVGQPSICNGNYQGVFGLLNDSPSAPVFNATPPGNNGTNNGNNTGGNGSYTEVDSCAVIDQAGEYRVTQDISGPSACIDIDADDVVLDCQDHTVSATLFNNRRRALHIEDGASNIDVRNCVFSVPASTGSEQVATLGQGANFSFDNVAFENGVVKHQRNVNTLVHHQGYFIINNSRFTKAISSGYNFDTYGFHIPSLHIENTEFQTASRPMFISSSIGEFTLRNNVFNTTNVEHIRFNGGVISGASSIVLDNNEFVGAPLELVADANEGPSSIRVTDNSFTTTHSSGALKLGNFDTGGDVLIENNVFSAENGPALELDDVHDAVIQYNDFNAYSGVYMYRNENHGLAFCRNDFTQTNTGASSQNFAFFSQGASYGNLQDTLLFENNIQADNGGISIKQGTNKNISIISNVITTNASYAAELSDLNSPTEVFTLMNNAFIRASAGDVLVVHGNLPIIDLEQDVQAGHNIIGSEGLGGNYYSDHSCSSSLAAYAGICADEYEVYSGATLLAQDQYPLTGFAATQLPCTGAGCAVMEDDFCHFEYAYDSIAGNGTNVPTCLDTSLLTTSIIPSLDPVINLTSQELQMSITSDRNVSLSISYLDVNGTTRSSTAAVQNGTSTVVMSFYGTNTTSLNVQLCDTDAASCSLVQSNTQTCVNDSISSQNITFVGALPVADALSFTTPPMLVNVTNSSASVVFDTNTNDTLSYEISYGTNISNLNYSITGNGTGYNSIDLSSLLPNATYYVNVTVCDASECISHLVKFDTLEANDSAVLAVEDTAPSFAIDPTVFGITDDRAGIRWETDESSTYTIDFGTVATNLDMSISSSHYALDNEAYLTNLDPSTQYFANVTVCDSAHNCVSDLVTFTTAAIPSSNTGGGSVGVGSGGGGGSGGSAARNSNTGNSANGAGGQNQFEVLEASGDSEYFLNEENDDNMQGFPDDTEADTQITQTTELGEFKAQSAWPYMSIFLIVALLVHWYYHHKKFHRKDAEHDGDTDAIVVGDVDVAADDSELDGDDVDDTSHDEELGAVDDADTDTTVDFAGKYSNNSAYTILDEPLEEHEIPEGYELVHDDFTDKYYLKIKDDVDDELGL